MYVILSISSNKEFTVLLWGVASISKSIRGVVWCKRLKTPVIEDSKPLKVSWLVTCFFKELNT